MCLPTGKAGRMMASSLGGLPPATRGSAPDGYPQNPGQTVPGMRASHGCERPLQMPLWAALAKRARKAASHSCERRNAALANDARKASLAQLRAPAKWRRAANAAPCRPKMWPTAGLRSPYGSECWISVPALPRLRQSSNEDAMTPAMVLMSVS